MKQILIGFMIILFLLQIAFFANRTYAESIVGTDDFGGYWGFEIKKTEATADGKDCIPVVIRKLRDFGQQMANVNIVGLGDDIDFRGDFSDVEKNTFAADPSNGWDERNVQIMYSVNSPEHKNATTDSKEFCLFSTSAGDRKIMFVLPNMEYVFKGMSVPGLQHKIYNVKFTAPPSFVATTPKPTTRKSTVTPGTTAPAAKPALTLTSTVNMQLNTAPIPVAMSESPAITKADKLTFAGTTSANAKVTLVIKSDPITKEVTADKDGKWSYTLDPKELGLGYGDHTITAYATDTAGVKSDELELAKFSINKPSPVEPTKLPPHKFNWRDLLTPINYGLGGVVIVLIGGLVYLIVRRRKVARDSNINL